MAAADRVSALVVVALKRRELQTGGARGAIGLIQRRLLQVEQRAYAPSWSAVRFGSCGDQTRSAPK
jgi:hypothetical protein